jgi:hypothetical protein
MGFTPNEIDGMSIWEFTAAVDGYSKANGGGQDTDAPSYEEHLEMVKRLGG